MLRVTLERWCINGTQSPAFVESSVMSLSCAKVQWSLYSTPGSRKAAFIPQSMCAINPGTVAFLDSGSGLRIGSCILLKDEGSQGLNYTLAGSKTPAKMANGDGIGEPTSECIPKPETPENTVIDISEDTPREYCEDFAHRGNLLVISRRRIPKSESAKKKSHRDRNRQGQSPRGSDSDSIGDDAGWSDLERDSEDDVNNGEAPAFSDTSSLRPRSSSDSLKSVSDNSTSSYANHESVSSGSEVNGFAVDSSSAENSDGSVSNSSLIEAEASDTDDTDSSSLLSAPSSESSDDEILDRQIVRGNSLELGGGYEYPVAISGQPAANWKNCDQCQEGSLETWYHCSVCARNDYDLCHQCVKNGEWCLDKKHQLYEEISGEGVVSVVSWSAFIPGQELLIFDINSRLEAPIFTHSVAGSETLHRSAPAIHPLQPLVVWPICAEKLLFVDVSNTNASKKRCFLEQTFKATSRKGTVSALHHYNHAQEVVDIINVARQISIDVFFSPKGDYLHVGSVEAQRRKSIPGSHIKRGLREKHHDLTFHVTTMQLSSTNPAKSRPTIVSRQCHALGKWTNPFVSILPYTWTWTPDTVYFTMTGLKLRVYRVPLPSPKTISAERSTTAESSCCSPALITTPRETIFLPRSARERSVHFYPSRESSPLNLRGSLKGPDSDTDSKRNSTLIIGPRYGPKASPPIGVYLSENDLGPWINVHDKEGEERMRPPKRRFTGPFEEFDEDDDCDIIPFDHGY